MSTSLDHYLEAEEAARTLEIVAGQVEESGGDPLPLIGAYGLIHAMLALAAVTALRGTHSEGELPFADANAWFEAASQNAPMPPEPVDEQDDEPEDDTIRVGSVSPTEPGELAEWLLSLPHRTILSGADGYPYQRGTGYETRHRQPDREFPALIGLGGSPIELTCGYLIPALDLTKNALPFTVLALGPEA